MKSVSPRSDDSLEAGLAAEVDHLVQSFGGLLVRGPIATAIDQVERLGGVGQRDHQGMVTPDAVVGDVDALLALGVGADESAVDVEDGLVEERRGLLGPDPQSRLIDGVHQGDDVGLGEAAAEVSFRGGVGEALGTQGIEINLIVASQFDVFDSLSAGQDVEGDVQDMVGFVIGQMSLQDVEVVVDVADQADPPRQQVHGADSAGGEALDAIGEFVVDVAGGHHRLIAFWTRAIRNAVEDPALTLA